MPDKISSLNDALDEVKSSSLTLADSPLSKRNLFLTNLAAAVEGRGAEILAENARDLAEAAGRKVGDAVLDRLGLDQKRLGQLAESLRETAGLPDPLGSVERLSTLPSGLTVGRRRVPLGVIGFICEARPGAAAEAAALAVKSGNALLAKPGRDSRRTSTLLGGIIGESLAGAGLPRRAVMVLPELNEEQLVYLLSRNDRVDLVIPRGGEGLVRFVDEHSRVPVLRHYKGVNHLYVDRSADPDMALDLLVDGKCDRPSTCNALECLLVDEAVAGTFLPLAADELAPRGVSVLGCPKTVAILSARGGPGLSLEPAGPGDYGREFLSLALAVKVVSGHEEALDHIRAHGSKHTECVVTGDLALARKFLRRVEAGCVMVNASPRLNDGGCLGLGCEIGISTSKLHAFGPMGLTELTTTKFVVEGDGHLRGSGRAPRADAGA
ncbi:MAG: glutamate-5-semialdehyde dehydrogenase [Deltaproteobacteria bacterium]|jgi:glutamate-5-semialdehyde dehydrogenase|nr:glutamate-5-semialdehyde dehydrogenase [Deltaproteobacteria bacterium]